MDWSKAKNILIIALLATNIFLFVTYRGSNENESSITDHEVLMSVLEGENVFLSTDIPKKYDKMQAITLKYSDCSQIIEKQLEKEEYIVQVDEEAAYFENTAEKFLKDCGLLNENIKFDRVIGEGKKKTVRYLNYYKGMKIGGSYVDVVFEDGRLTEASRQFISAAAKGKRKLTVISPEEALLMFMSEKNSEAVVNIENMELVFWLNDSTFDGEMLVSDTAFPAWQIVYNDGNIKYIEAYRE